MSSSKLPPLENIQIENISEDELREILDKVIQFAENNLQSTERETYDFKKDFEGKWDLTANENKIKENIRKHFSAFANTRGGWIIFGIEEVKDKDKYALKITGIKNLPDDARIHQILSEKGYVRPSSVEFTSRVINYKGKRILIYQIYKSRYPIEVRKRGRWVAYIRERNTVREMSQTEIILKFYMGEEKLPKGVNPSELGFYSCNGSKKPYIEWTIRNITEIAKWLEVSPFCPIVFLPLPVMPFRNRSEIYYTSSRCYGDYEELLDILMEIERMVSKIGLTFEVWTIWAPINVKTYLENQHYITGCNAQSLKDCIDELHGKLRKLDFGWLMFSNVVYIIIGKVYQSGDDYKFQLEIRSLFSFIPNNFPFVCIEKGDVGARVTLKPLRVYERKWWDDMLVKQQRINFTEKPFLVKLSEQELINLPPAKIVGYLSEELKPRDYDWSIRTSIGLTVLEFQDLDTQPPLHPFISNATKVFTFVSTHPPNLNDLNEIRVSYIELEAHLFMEIISHNLILVLFNISCGLDQLEQYKLQ